LQKPAFFRSYTIRDYIHVDDLAAAQISALQLLLSGEAGGIFNVGTGIGYSTMQILEAVRVETGETVPWVMRARRAGDPPILVADPSYAERRLGFKASSSDLSHIILSAWAWHRKAHPRID
jgi:UDP-arabinose 4-epimerase